MKLKYTIVVADDTDPDSEVTFEAAGFDPERDSEMVGATCRLDREAINYLAPVLFMIVQRMQQAINEQHVVTDIPDSPDEIQWN